MSNPVRPPSDAVVALRSLGRRYRELFTQIDEGGGDGGGGGGDTVDELAQRHGSDGRSALDHVVAATRSITFLARALELLLIEEDPVLHPAVLDAAAREWPPSTGTVTERVTEIAWEADALAERAAHVTATEWARRARVAGHDATVSATDVLWDAVDTAIGHLRSAQRTLAEVV